MPEQLSDEGTDTIDTFSGNVPIEKRELVPSEGAELLSN